jgi:hypothetical protein
MAKKGTYYYKEWSWRRSPEVWRSVSTWIGASFLLGWLIGATGIGETWMKTILLIVAVLLILNPSS